MVNLLTGVELILIESGALIFLILNFFLFLKIGVLIFIHIFLPLNNIWLKVMAFRIFCIENLALFTST